MIVFFGFEGCAHSQNLVHKPYLHLLTIDVFTLWKININMENGHCIVDVVIENVIFHRYVSAPEGAMSKPSLAL